MTDEKLGWAWSENIYVDKALESGQEQDKKTDMNKTSV